MNYSTLMTTSPHAWQFSGELTFATVPTVVNQLYTTTTWPTEIDLQNVTRADSAGLALLIELRKLTRKKPVTFLHLPDQLLSLASVYGVKELLQ